MFFFDVDILRPSKSGFRRRLRRHCIDNYLLLRPVLLCYQGNVLMTNHFRAVHGKLLRAGFVRVDHRRRVGDVGVVDGVCR